MIETKYKVVNKKYAKEEVVLSIIFNETHIIAVTPTMSARFEKTEDGLFNDMFYLETGDVVVSEVVEPAPEEVSTPVEETVVAEEETVSDVLAAPEETVEETVAEEITEGNGAAPVETADEEVINE